MSFLAKQFLLQVAHADFFYAIYAERAGAQVAAAEEGAMTSTRLLWYATAIRIRRAPWKTRLRLHKAVAGRAK